MKKIWLFHKLCPSVFKVNMIGIFPLSYWLLGWEPNQGLYTCYLKLSGQFHKIAVINMLVSQLRKGLRGGLVALHSHTLSGRDKDGNWVPEN